MVMMFFSLCLVSPLSSEQTFSLQVQALLCIFKGPYKIQNEIRKKKIPYFILDIVFVFPIFFFFFFFFFFFSFFREKKGERY